MIWRERRAGRQVAEATRPTIVQQQAALGPYAHISNPRATHPTASRRCGRGQMGATQRSTHGL